MNKKYFLTICVLALTACSSGTYTQKESPNNAYKDYKGFDNAVLGVGKTISDRKSEANATISYKRKYPLNKAIIKFANKYSLSVEWDDAVNRHQEKYLMAKDQTFNEARAYLEDIYGISIVRQRDRAIKIMVPATVNRLETFNPGPNVSLADAVDGLSGLCGMNLVIADYKSVLKQERITTSLANVTCDQAFEAILEPFGLSLKSRGTHYTITGLPYKEWSLNLHEQKRDEKSEISYVSEFSGTSESSDSSTKSGGSTSTAITYTRDLWASLTKDLEELVKKSCENSKNIGYEPRSHKAETESGKLVSTGNRERPCGYVRVNPDVGLVQMQAPSRVIEKADDIIVILEEIASRRLFVEARVLAVSKDREFDRSSDLAITGGIAGTDFTLGYSPTEAFSSSTSVAGTLSNMLDADHPGGQLGLLANDLDAVVRYVESFTTTYNLMKPTLEVMDRQRATLIDGKNERYFVKSAESDTDDDGNILVSTKSEENIQFEGIQFTVSAQIAEDEGDLHTVALQIPITEIERWDEDTILSTGIEVTNRYPIATTRVIDQKVRLRDGEIKVIGGLTKTIAVDKETGVPYLQEVPVAGKAFSEESVRYEDVEFVVLLQVKRLD